MGAPLGCESNQIAKSPFEPTKRWKKGERQAHAEKDRLKTGTKRRLTTA